MFLFGIQFDLELHTNLCQYVMQNSAAKNNVIDITFTLAERCIWKDFNLYLLNIATTILNIATTILSSIDIVKFVW